MSELPLLSAQKHSWRILDVFIILFLAMFIIPTLFIWVVQFISEIRGLDLNLEELQAVTLLPAIFLQELALLWLTLASVKRGYGRPYSTIGVVRLPLGRTLSAGLLWGGGLFWAQTMAEQLSHLVFSLFMDQDKLAQALAEETDQVLSLFSIGQSPFGVALLVLLLVIVVPLAEEIFFRGFAYNAFKERYGRQGAVFASALVFALMHGYIIEFVPIFVVGIGLGYVVKHFGSLWPGVIGHALVNLAAVLVGLLSH